MSDDITVQVFPVERYGVSLSNVPKTEAEGLLGGLVALRQESYSNDGMYTTGTQLLDSLINALSEIAARK